MIREGYPNTRCALIIIRDRPEQVLTSAISNIALFEVALAGRRDVRFTLEHAFFDSDQTRVEIIDGLRQRISLSAELLVSRPHAAYHRSRRAAVTGHLLSPSDVELIARQRADHTILPVMTSEARLCAKGTRKGLDIPRRGSTPSHWRRRAPLVKITECRTKNSLKS